MRTFNTLHKFVRSAVIGGIEINQCDEQANVRFSKPAAEEKDAHIRHLSLQFVKHPEDARHGFVTGRLHGCETAKTSVFVCEALINNGNTDHLLKFFELVGNQDARCQGYSIMASLINAIGRFVSWLRWGKAKKHKPKQA